MKKQKEGAEGFSALLLGKLQSRGVSSPEAATAKQWYMALTLAARELLAARERAFSERVSAERGRRVAYLCMEFLVGRPLVETLEALGVRGETEEELSRFGISLSELYELERDPGLGNGGLGRLAACFLDSLASLSYPAIGYSLCYEAGLFRQRIVDGEQVELPDDWTGEGGAWLIPRPEMAVTVRFGGRILEEWQEGVLHVTHVEYDEVRAVPYDLLVPGVMDEGVAVLRLFRARDPSHRPDGSESQSGYVKAMREKTAAEELTRQLYPPDNHEEGKLLRLCQQYFLVSAALQNIIAGHFSEGESLATLGERVAIHLNDTHPALAIPELMRLLLDLYSFSWDEAFSLVRSLFSYTNHTVMPEALECWRADLFRVKLPRIYAILEEMNRKMTAALWERYPGDWERISRMAIIAYGQVRMANLSVFASHTVNGVSRLHSEILTRTVFSDFYKTLPERFTGVTNGVTHRRWLLHANRRLAALIDSTIGEGYRRDPEALSGLLAYREDPVLLTRLLAVKRENKERFSRFLSARGRPALDPDAVYDVQIKRMHEYKRQLLNALKILSLWQELREGGGGLRRGVVFLFGAKAAAGYYMAKEILRLLVALGEEIAADPLVRDMLRLEFCEDYNVSMAEVLIPAADISEQISLAGKEASGTGCMKLMMNGALTLGTMDGANVEIAEAVGEENFYSFGLRETEVEELWRSGYDARSYYRTSPRIRAAIDRLYFPLAGRDFSHIAEYLAVGTAGVADPYMCLADFESYRTVFDGMLTDYEDRMGWARRSLVNIAASGRFAADRSIREYAERIWHLRRIGE